MVKALSTPSCNMTEIFLSPSQIKNVHFQWNLFMSNGSTTLGRTFLFFTTRLLDFWWKVRGYDYSPVDSNGQPSFNIPKFTEKKELTDNLYHRIGAIIFQNFCPQFWDLVEGSFSQVVT